MIFFWFFKKMFIVAQNIMTLFMSYINNLYGCYKVKQTYLFFTLNVLYCILSNFLDKGEDRITLKASLA